MVTAQEAGLQVCQVTGASEWTSSSFSRPCPPGDQRKNLVCRLTALEKGGAV